MCACVGLPIEWYSCVWLHVLSSCHTHTTGMTHFQVHEFIFGIKLYMFRTVPLSIIRSFSL